MKKWLWVVLIWISSVCFGDTFVELKQVENSHSTVSVGVVSEGDVTLNITVEMPEGWYSYGEDPGEIGKPLSVKWGNSLNKNGPLIHPDTIRKQEGVFEVNAIPEKGVWRLPFLNQPKYLQGELSINYLVCKDSCVPQRATISVNTAEKTEGLIRHVRAIIAAFLGGLILNLMPCVFPVLFLKVLSLIKSKEYVRAQRIQAGMGYATGILLSFMTLALALLGLKWAGLTVGWGFHLQSPYFVMSLALVFLMVTLNLAGRLEIPPSILSGFGRLTRNLSTSKSNHIFVSNLNTGVLATAVATPCTAPLMAPAIAYAFTQSISIMLAIFASLGLGMALPYVLAVNIPAVSTLLPKPGRWMERAKQWMSLPMGATLLWLLWVLKQQIIWYHFISFTLVIVSFAAWRQKRSIAILIVAAIIATAGFWQENPKIKTETAEILGQIEQQKGTFLVDVTADWCITCKANELWVLNTQEMQQFFKDNQVKVLTLDWTNYSPEITTYLESFNRNGVPLYVLYKEGKPQKYYPKF